MYVAYTAPEVGGLRSSPKLAPTPLILLGSNHVQYKYLILFIRVLAYHYFCIVNLRPEMNSVATNYMPEVISDLSYDLKKMIESCPQAAS